jgi:Cu(I)/Ag(I) efflux system membrane protein CusA/SilA
VLLLASEVLPPLDEADLRDRPPALPGVARLVGAKSRRAAVTDPSNDQTRARGGVGLWQGRPGRNRHDPAPLEMFESTVQLKPRDQWRPGMIPDTLVDALNQAIKVPVLSKLWVPQIRNCIDMLATRIEQLAKTVPGVSSALAERLTGGRMSVSRFFAGPLAAMA